MDDDQETYITERTSVPSVTKRVSFPESIYPAKDPHSLQYVYNQLPDNGVPLATQYKQAKEQEKKSKKSFRKAAPGQGTLAPLPERVPEFNENYYPYTYYNQVKQPDKPKLFHHTTDGQIVANDSLDLSQYIHEPIPQIHQQNDADIVIITIENLITNLLNQSSKLLLPNSCLQ